MKKWLSILTIIILSLGIVACGKKDNRTSVRPNTRDSRTDQNNGNNNSRSTVSDGTGKISTTQERIDLFLAVMGDPAKLIGRIDTSGAAVTFDGSASINNSGEVESAKIRLVIKDEWAVSGEVKPMEIETFEFVKFESQYRETYSGYDEVVLTFYDKNYDQALILEGTVQHASGSDFKGTMYFENEDVADTDGEVVLGDFTIPACSFFKCNN
ncbi:MAG: hypothetical protein KDD58_04225 [Bdellovibrionales bacterium]|nr:hypothetical protein [Bdellovibrionales bacterium]